MTLLQDARRASLMAACALGWGLAASPHLRINTTPSMPLGLWGVVSPAYALPRGTAVLACLPGQAAIFASVRGYIAHGDCPGDVEVVLKRIVAVAGDVVTVSEGGLAVNGVALPGTAPRKHDTAGRDMPAVPAGTYAVEPGTVWLSTSQTRSYDSRYFGAVPLVSVHGRAFPIITGSEAP